ncbi:hypothetical protein P153DRAFT_367105 [Dothidotthia symphoricarpi CBS 119687]|uniref:WD40 repeat-like protein n=1 Tax=Dothidotthia symphoricarpi CBS 119687 TaxID=1392245 RepID=A0A6A6A9Z7_9PLEO|nr:uncharacterized protein P153DRAFT_367105 [Dothidotthia symphoricarpi CBS 119687]KAF2128752.1 hypothetical protein P153DRAFT_367105 [Dothidotthia symphoricarpi CBS 119687]
MNGQPIPGFYFDPDKKKYFRIQTSTAARDLDIKHSAENIRKEERRSRLNRAAAVQSNKTRRERVVRRNATNFTQTCLEREIGFRRRSFYVQSMWPDACMSGVATRLKKVVDAPDASIRLFDRDPISKTIYAVIGENRIKRRRVHTTSDLPLPDQDLETGEYFNSMSLNAYAFEPWDELVRTTSTVSSLCYLPVTGALATTTLGADRPPTVHLSDPERDGPYVGQLFTPKSCTAIRGAAARPTSFAPSPGLENTVAATHTEHLAVAASQSLLLFTRSPTGSWDSATALDDLKSDILSLDWISYTTIALGCRNGNVRLYDTRSGGSSRVLTHSQPIAKIKRADDPTRLVVSGLEDTLFLYDIRSPRFCGPSESSFKHSSQHYNKDYFNTRFPEGRDRKKRRKMEHTAFKKWSQPVLSFPHANLDDLDLDVDVHPRLGLVAAAQDLATSSAAIRVSNLWTGKTVKEFTPNKTGPVRNKTQERIRTLKFMDDEEGGGVNLWATMNGGIVQFGW